METPNPPQRTSNLPTDVARLPIPGNAELLIYILALFIAMLVCWIADSLGSADWFAFFRWVTVAYILSRGIAKASRVLEQ
jgi:positive regulator of sigma E activity